MVNYFLNDVFGEKKIIIFSIVLIFGSIFVLNNSIADAQLCFAPTCNTGNFYIANSGDNTVKLFAKAGGPPIDVDWAADAINYIPTISHHKAVAIDSSGNVYVGFGGPHNLVMKFDSVGNVLDPSFAATIPTLGAIAFDSADNLYVSYTAIAHASIMKFDSTGTEVLPRFIPAFVVGNVLDMTFDSADNLYIVDANAAAIRKFDSNGAEILPTFITGLSTPQSIALDSAGNVYVSVSSQVQQYDSTGTLINPTFATGMIFARDIAFDSDGLFYVAEADASWNTVRQYAATGGVSIANSFATGLNNPRDMVFSGQLAENILLAGVDIGGVCEVDLASGSLPFGTGDPIANGAGVGIAEISEVLTNTLGNLQSNVGVYGTDWTDGGVLNIMDGSHTKVSTSSVPFGSKTSLSTNSGSPTALGNIVPQGSITTYWDVEIVLDGGNPGYSGSTQQTITFDFTCV